MRHEQHPILRVRGLPYSARADDVVDFFKDVKLENGRRGVYFPQGPNGRSNGEAFVELESPDDLEKALKKHHENMGRRYIEVFQSDKNEMYAALGRNVHDNFDMREYVVRLRGLPYDTEKKEIFAFFNGLDIAPNGIGLLVDHMGRSTGEAYVQFTSAEMLARAKEKHMEKIGHRYIEIFESSMMEANMAIQRQIDMNQGCVGGGPPGPMMGGGRGRDFGPGGYNYYGGGGPQTRGGNGPMPPVGGPMMPGGGGAAGPYNNGRSVQGGMGGGRPGPYARPLNMMGGNGDMRGPGGGPANRGGLKSGGCPNMMGSPMMGNGGSLNMMDQRDRRMGLGVSGMNDQPMFEDWQSTTGHSIRMRGLPYSANMEEVTTFLAPLQPVNIHMRFSATGRPNGEVDVDFASHDEAKEAMKKDREKIGSRYIELFLNSTPMGNGPNPNAGMGSKRFGASVQMTGVPAGPGQMGAFDNGSGGGPRVGAYCNDVQPMGYGSGVGNDRRGGVPPPRGGELPGYGDISNSGAAGGSGGGSAVGNGGLYAGDYAVGNNASGYAGGGYNNNNNGGYPGGAVSADYGAAAYAPGPMNRNAGGAPIADAYYDAYGGGQPSVGGGMQPGNEYGMGPGGDSYGSYQTAGNFRQQGNFY